MRTHVLWFHHLHLFVLVKLVTSNKRVEQSSPNELENNEESPENKTSVHYFIKHTLQLA